MDAAVGTELIKLLLQIVTADDVVTQEEHDALLDAAARLAGEGGKDIVIGCLDQKKPLPAPNMGVLMKYRSDVLVEVARVAGADGVHREELDLVKVISEMLS